MGHKLRAILEAAMCGAKGWWCDDGGHPIIDRQHETEWQRCRWGRDRRDSELLACESFQEQEPRVISTCDACAMFRQQNKEAFESTVSQPAVVRFLEASFADLSPSLTASGVMSEAWQQEAKQTIEAWYPRMERNRMKFYAEGFRPVREQMAEPWVIEYLRSRNQRTGGQVHLYSPYRSRSWSQH